MVFKAVDRPGLNGTSASARCSIGEQADHAKEKDCHSTLGCHGDLDMNARTPRDLHSDLGPSSKDWLPDSERSPEDAKAPFGPEPEASAGDEEDARPETGNERKS